MTSFSHGQKSMIKKMDRLLELGLQEEYLHLGEQVFAGTSNAETQAKFWSIESKLQVYNQKFSSTLANRLQPAFEVAMALQSDLMQADYSKEFQKLKMPILITAGLHDIIALQRPQEMHTLSPSSKLAKYKDSGHMPFLEENELFVKQTADWLRNNSLR